MRSGEFRRLPDIQRKGVSISTQQGRHGLEIHSGEFYDGFRRHDGEGSCREKARDMVEAYADELANVVLRGCGIIREKDNLLLG